jgi:hypothetical protein
MVNIATLGMFSPSIGKVINRGGGIVMVEEKKPKLAIEIKSVEIIDKTTKKILKVKNVR